MNHATPATLSIAVLGFMFGLPEVRSADERRAPNVPNQSVAAISGRVRNETIGRYLPHARVSVKGTAIVVFTDEFGEYRLTQVPAGPVVLEVFYTGLDLQEIRLQTAPGQTVVQDVDMTNVSRYGQNTDAVKLDAFIVSTSKDVEGEALAVNEQRFAPNIKNVVSTDTFGDIQEGNVGEFMKFLPGVTVNYNGAEAQSISVRGFSPNQTAITVDGAQTANANYLGSARDPYLSQTSINNISRVELSKVPTPSSPADSLGGSINMVSKSAFERSRAELRYRFFLSGNSLRLRLKDPYPTDENTYKILPNFDFDYTLPMGKNFGIVVTGMASNFFNENRTYRAMQAIAGAGTGASVSNPFLTTVAIIDAPRYTWRKALGLNADWRVTPNSVLSVGFDISDFRTQAVDVSRTSTTGANGTPTIAVANGGVPLTFGPDFTIGATGRGSVTLSSSSTRRYENTAAGRVRYRFDNGDWRITANVNRSTSSAKFRGSSDATGFSSLAATLDQPVRVSLTNVTPLGDGDATTVVRTFLNDGREVDFNNIANYRVTSATIAVRDITDDMGSAEASVRRRLSFLPFPAALQIGGLQRVQKRDTLIPLRTFTYNGEAGNLLASPYQHRVYVNQDSGYGVHNVSYIDVGKASRAFEANPALFSQTPPQVVAEAVSRITGSEYMRETVSAYYAQAETQLFSNRLKLLTGVRYEKTKGEGQGPVFDPSAVFVRSANGTFARNAQGAQIRKPEAGAAGSIEEVRLTRQERGHRARGTYDGYYPGLHITYEITDQFLVRAAYARTYGRPNFNEIIPNVVISENDLDEGDLSAPGVIPGTLTVRNSNLRPWTADNYDLSVEYYSTHGGTFTAGVFQKDIQDFFANVVKTSTAADIEQFGLDPRYVGFRLSTKVNAGDARVSGAEFNIRQSLAPLSSWVRHFSGFANATKLRLEGDRQADFRQFIPESASWGVTFHRDRLTLMAKWNWRGIQKNTAFPNLGPDAWTYTGGRTHLDLNLDYQFARRMSFFVNARNVFNAPNVVLRYGSETPEHAKVFASGQYGAQLGAGIKGSF